MMRSRVATFTQGAYMWPLMTAKPAAKPAAKPILAVKSRLSEIHIGLAEIFLGQ